MLVNAIDGVKWSQNGQVENVPFAGRRRVCTKTLGREEDASKKTSRLNRPPANQHFQNGAGRLTYVRLGERDEYVIEAMSHRRPTGHARGKAVARTESTGADRRRALGARRNRDTEIHGLRDCVKIIAVNVSPLLITAKDDELVGASSRLDAMGVLAIWSVRGRDLVPHLTEQTANIRGFQILVEAFRLWELYEPNHTEHADRLDDFFLLVEQAFARIVGWRERDWELPGARRVRARSLGRGRGSHWRIRAGTCSASRRLTVCGACIVARHGEPVF